MISTFIHTTSNIERIHEWCLLISRFILFENFRGGGSCAPLKSATDLHVFHWFICFPLFTLELIFNNPRVLDVIVPIFDPRGQISLTPVIGLTLHFYGSL